MAVSGRAVSGRAVAVAVVVAVIAVLGASAPDVPTEGWGFGPTPDGMVMTDDRIDDDIDRLAMWIDDETEAALRDAGFMRRESRSWYAEKLGGLDVVVIAAADPERLHAALDAASPAGPGRPYDLIPGALLRPRTGPLGDGAINHTYEVAYVDGPFLVQVAGWGYNMPTARVYTEQAISAQLEAMGSTIAYDPIERVPGIATLPAT